MASVAMRRCLTKVTATCKACMMSMLANHEAAAHHVQRAAIFTSSYYDDVVVYVSGVVGRVTSKRRRM
eukprot:CAMPEP_0118943334 /NCGR_PEP_ID=MMETSP1169-20130426/38106_1 /TAXON_ID=36882 /ORGANISM="Pyramimonas obovata, Strain CCMP722" /LENGTH=67 /DNA_ID=CAMNT_0006888569 /DNA_START=190 /DNA_END=393 /DNA_ORIENTATION=-